MIDTSNFKVLSDAIYSNYNITLDEYAFTIFKRKISKALISLNFKNIESFIENVSDDQELLQKFLYDITVEETEMFRDPNIWKTIKESVLPTLSKNTEFTVWLPDVSSGDDLFSIAILLQEIGCYNQAKIIVSSPVLTCLEKLQNCIFSKEKIKINNSNYSKFEGKKELSDYYSLISNSMHMHSSLLENVTFINQSILNVPINEVNLIIFRNKMLFYNHLAKSKILIDLYKKLHSSGFLICGLNESLGESNLSFKAFDEFNKIYLKN